VKTYDVKYSTEIVPVDPDPDVVLGSEIRMQEEMSRALAEAMYKAVRREEARIFIGALDK